jgi:hypothetical protein
MLPVRSVAASVVETKSDSAGHGLPPYQYALMPTDHYSPGYSLSGRHSAHGGTGDSEVDKRVPPWQESDNSLSNKGRTVLSTIAITKPRVAGVEWQQSGSPWRLLIRHNRDICTMEAVTDCHRGNGNGTIMARHATACAAATPGANP